MANYQFPPDEFDAYESRPTPVGVHRAPRSRWSRLWPFLLVAALFASAAIVGIWSLTREQEVAGPQEAPPVIVEPIDNGNGEAVYDPDDPEYQGEDGEVDGEEHEYVEANVIHDVAIRVLNDTGPTGEAGRGRDRLTEHGFTSVVADNFPGDSGLTASTVWYSDPEYHDSALAVAEALGIPADRVTEHSVTGATIAVVVRGSLGLQ